MTGPWDLVQLVGESVAAHSPCYELRVRVERNDAATIEAHMWLVVVHGDKPDEKRSITHTWSVKQLRSLRAGLAPGVIEVDVVAANRKLTEGLR